MRRIERLINLIAALLEAGRPMSAQEIRDHIAGYDGQPSFEAFRRAFERDKETLRAMGIPLEVVALDLLDDRVEGYAISKQRYYLPDIDLESDELAALRIAAEAIIGGAGDAATGLLKLSVDMPDTGGGGPRIVWGADLAAEQPVLGPLYSALIDRRVVRFQYQPAGEAAARLREVEPYRLVHRRGHWYLVGRDRGRDAVRSFRASRIAGEVATLEGTYDVPESFNAEAVIGGEPWALGPDPVEATTVRFDSAMRWWPAQNLPELAGREAPGGGVDVELPVANLDALVSWVIGFGPGVEIVAPAAARRRLLEHLAPYLEAGA